MDVAKWLEDLALGQYADLFVESEVTEDDLLNMTHKDLQDLGVKAFRDRKKILNAIEELKPGETTDSPSPTAFIDIESLPTVLAVPLREYADEANPVMKLWHACDVVELTLRLTVAIGLADLQKDGKLPKPLLKELRPRIEEPTLGKWKGMALAVARGYAGVKTVVPEVAPLVNGVLVPLLDGADATRAPETSFSSLRNQLAHGGGVTRAVGARLLEIWAPRFEAATRAVSWLSECAFVVRTTEDERVVRDVESALSRGDAMVLVRGASVLRLWPLAAYGLPRSLDPDAPPARDVVPQMYVRRGEVRLQFTPLGSDEVCQSEGDEAASDAFMQLMRLDEAEEAAKVRAFSVRDFERDIRKDAGRLVGRADELQKIRGALTENRNGVLWMTGPAGIGKSYIIARIAAEFLDEPPENTIVLPYRFKAGDDRCARSSFLTFAIERLLPWVVPDEDDDAARERKQKKPIDQLDELLGDLGDRCVLFILDGLDELAERDEAFARDVPLRLRPDGVTWLCAGRPERGLPEAFASAAHLFPDGLPPMDEIDIRRMLLEKMGPMRKRLIRNDTERAGRVMNPFVSRVAECAGGLPLYVKYVVADVLAGRYRALDAGERLPPSLDRYHEELLRRCAVGSLQQILTPLAATIAVAREALSVGALTHVLRERNLLTEEDAVAGLVEKGLAAIASMLRSSETPEGEQGYALYHHSLREHMERSELIKGALATARMALCNLATEAAEAVVAIKGYLLRHGVTHLVASERWDDVGAVLMDFGYLYCKNERLGPHALVEDYENALGPGSTRLGEMADTLTLMADAIRLAAHAIANDPMQLASQLIGRLDTAAFPATTDFVHGLGARVSHPWLRPVSPTLVRAGGPLRQILRGHSLQVNGVAVSANGKRAVTVSLDKTLRQWDLDQGLEAEAPINLDSRQQAVALSPDATRAIPVGGRSSAVWDLATGSILFTLVGHETGMRCACVTPDGRRALTGSYDTTVRVWDLSDGRLLATLAGHFDTVNGVAVTPDGTHAVSASADETLKVWYLHDYGEVRELAGHTMEVWSVAVTPDGRKAVSGSKDNTLRIWDLATGRELGILSGHRDCVSAVAITPDGRYAVSGSHDSDLRVWDLDSHRNVRTFPGQRFSVNAVTIAPDGSRALAAYDDSTVKVWDLTASQEWHHISSHPSPVLSVSMLPDASIAHSVAFEGPAKRWEVATGEEVASLDIAVRWLGSMGLLPDGQHAVAEADDWKLSVRDLTTGLISSTAGQAQPDLKTLAVTPDGKRAVWLTDDRALIVRDLRPSKEPPEVEAAEEPTHGGVSAVIDHDNAVPDAEEVATSPQESPRLGDVWWVEVTRDGMLAVSASDDLVTVWNIERSQEVHAFTGHTNRVRTAAVTPDGMHVLSAGDDDTVIVWRLADGQVVKEFSWPGSRLLSAIPTPDGEHAILTTWDGCVEVWSLRTCASVRKLLGHTGAVAPVAVTPDGIHAVTASADGTLGVWQIQSGKRLHTLMGHEGEVRSVATTPDGKLAVSASEDRKLKIWDLANGDELRTLRGHREGVEAVAVSSDGKHIVSSAGWSGDPIVWDLATGQRLRTLASHSSWANTVAAMPDPARVISGSNDGTLRIWDVVTGEELQRLGDPDRWDADDWDQATPEGPPSINSAAVSADGSRAVFGAGPDVEVWDVLQKRQQHVLTGHWGNVSAVALSHDGSIAVSASDDTTLRVWDPTSGCEIRALFGHTQPVLSLAVSPDGRFAVSGSLDFTARLWDLRSGECIAAFTGDSIVYSCAVSGDGRTVVVGAGSGRVHFLRLEAGSGQVEPN